MEINKAFVSFIKYVQAESSVTVEIAPISGKNTVVGYYSTVWPCKAYKTVAERLVVGETIDCAWVAEKDVKQPCNIHSIMVAVPRCLWETEKSMATDNSDDSDD